MTGGVATHNCLAMPDGLILEVWVRPGADGRRPNRIAAILAEQYVPLFLATWIGSPAMATPAAFSFLLFSPCEWFLLLNSHLQNMLSGIPMLWGITVALKQS
jgi:hypothetical protein